jgi:hypothetical protein
VLTAFGVVLFQTRPDQLVQLEHVALKPVLPYRRCDFHSFLKLRVSRCPQMDRRSRSSDAAGERRDSKPGVGELDQLVAKGTVVVARTALG